MARSYDDIAAFVGLKALSYVALAAIGAALVYAGWAVLTYFPVIRV